MFTLLFCLIGRKARTVYRAILHIYGKLSLFFYLFAPVANIIYTVDIGLILSYIGYIQS